MITASKPKIRRAGPMAGFMMQKGVAIVCGDAADGVADSMYAGTVYVGGVLSTVGGQTRNRVAAVDPLTGAERDAVMVSLDDLTRLGLESGQRVRLSSPDGVFEGRLLQAPIKPGNLEVHWPEGNTLLSGAAIDPDSMEPDYNAVVTLEAI